VHHCVFSIKRFAILATGRVKERKRERERARVKERKRESEEGRGGGGGSERERERESEREQLGPTPEDRYRLLDQHLLCTVLQ
jgi:hypothetical protein